MNTQSALAFEPPRVTLRAEPSYLIGFPILIAVTFENDSKEMEYYGLPDVDVTYDHGPLGVTMVAASGARHVAGPSELDEGITGLSLMPGERKAVIVDLANFGFPLQPDVYTVTVTLRIGKYEAVSDPVRFTLVKPSPADETEASRLRNLGRPSANSTAWISFLTRNWNTVRPSSNLSSRAREQLALHLFLHFALYGPRRVGDLDVEPLMAIRQPSLSMEVTALGFEIRVAQLDDAGRKSLFDAVMNRVPAVKFRLERVLEGEGFLTMYRQAVGAEAPLTRPLPAPYTIRE